MNIYLIRHGDAERSSASISDFDRKLTKEGENSVRMAAEKWKNLVNVFDYIVTSPLVRAVQTAEIIADVYKYDEKLIKDDKLISGGLTEDLINLSNSLDGEDIAFVGHQPDLSYHVSHLITNGHSLIEFKKGAIAKIAFYNRVQAGKGELEFLIPPKVFR